jgi:hypothetical protein
MQSVGDMEIYKHGTSVLTMKADAVSNQNTEVDGRGTPQTKLFDATGKNMLLYEGDTPPAYLVKDLVAVEKAYDRASGLFADAIQNERTMQSIFKKRDTVRESGNTKDYDAEPARAALRATAEDLEICCKKILNMVARLLGQEKATDGLVCEFPESFILTEKFSEKLDEIAKAVTAKYPSATGMREMYKALTPSVAHNEQMRIQIDKEIDDAPINVDYDAQVNAAVSFEVDAEKKFQESIKGMTPKEQSAAKAKRKLDMVKTNG